MVLTQQLCIQWHHSPHQPTHPTLVRASSCRRHMSPSHVAKREPGPEEDEAHGRPTGTANTGPIKHYGRFSVQRRDECCLDMRKYAGKSGGVGFPPTCLTPAGVLCMGLYDNVFEAHGTRYECTSGHFTLVMSMCYVKLEAAVCEASPEASDKICVLPSFDDAVYIAAALRVASLQGVWSASRRWLRLSRHCTISCSKDHSPLPVIQHMLALRYIAIYASRSPRALLTQACATEVK